jgi:hypothetical protein
LVLNEDGSAFLVSRVPTDANETVLAGSWQEDQDQSARVTLSHLTDGSQLASPVAFRFHLEAGDMLVADEFDPMAFGETGLRMLRTTDLALATEAQALAVEAGPPIGATQPLTGSVVSTAPVPSDVAPPTAPVQADAVPPAAAASPLVGAWQLQQINRSDDMVFLPDVPAGYVVTFAGDGNLTVVADCNDGSGTYQAGADGSLAIQLAATNTYCGAGTLSPIFVTYLNAADSYASDDSQLIISFGGDSGTMTFAPGS